MTCHHTDVGPMLATHVPDCERADCGGCIPCPETHCTARSRCLSHVAPTELTCPGCIGQTRTDLAQVVELSALMLGEAIVRGINSEAANLAGPAADPAVWSARQVIKRRHITEHLPAEAWEYATRVLIEDDDDWHPLLVLGRWEMMLREDWGPETDTRLTVSSAADYLERNLPRLANDPAQDFPLFATEIRACRTHLEAVLHDSRQPEKGAPCPTCTTEQQRGPALVKRYDDDDATGASDTWLCKRCDSWWSEADYRLRVGARYLQHADRLTADQMAERLRVPPGTIRSWASPTRAMRDGTMVELPPKLPVAGRSESGQKLYSVKRAEELRG